MIELELFRVDRETPFSERDPTDLFSGWRLIGKCRLVTLPSVLDQIRIAPGQIVRVRGVMHVAERQDGGEKHEASVRLMVEAVPDEEVLGPA